MDCLRSTYCPRMESGFMYHVILCLHFHLVDSIDGSIVLVMRKSAYMVCFGCVLLKVSQELERR